MVQPSCVEIGAPRGAVIGGPVGGLLDERADADAADRCLARAVGLLLPQPGIVHQLDEPLQAFVERHGFELAAPRRRRMASTLSVDNWPPELDRSMPSLAAAKSVSTSRDDAGQRHADAAVHADQVLVDVEAAGARPVVLEL